MSEIDETKVAGNGILDRRIFLKGTLAGGAGLLSARAGAQALPEWSKLPGAGMSESGAPSPHESNLRRVGIRSRTGTTGAGSSRSPLEFLDGIITPSRLHFERHHSGIPEIDPNQHQLVIHGLVDRPLTFDLDALHRYPTVSRIQFLECSGNSGGMTAGQAPQRTCSQLHGLVSASEWGGVPLAILLDEAGVKPEAKWVVASGADAAKMARSVPMDKILDDAIVALYQNGEPLRPSNGYPMRLFLPGWEGNASVKWLQSIKVLDQPSMSRDETSKYSDLEDSGILKLFSFPMGVKSLITSPSPALEMHETGIYQISGIAWSGAGRIRRVEVSADGGTTWADAMLDDHVLPKCLTRFRTAWRWDGGEARLLSRATDESGAIQPTRAEVMRGRARGTSYHYNGIQAWQVSDNGVISNVFV